MTDADWVTQRDAARLLGVHHITVAKMVRRGVLTSRMLGRRCRVPRCSRSWLRVQAAAAELEALRTAARPGPQPPDDEHDWLLAPAAAAVLGCTETALYGRATRGKVPYVLHDRRRWFRLDLLELLVRAHVARQRQK